MSWSAVQQEPTFGFTVVGLIVVFGPLVAEKLRLPGLLGLLFGGALIGPNILDVLPSFEALDSVGSIGVLYLIFLAGMQLDIDSFIRYRRVSFGFGLLTAFIPLVLGTAAALMLDFDFAAAVLIGSFWASFTLITYPTLSSYGLTRNRAVAAVVGASSITDTISLVILAFVIGAETGDSSPPRLALGIALGMGVLAVWCFVVVPWVARWFFAGLGEERTLRYMFVLVSLTSSAVVAELVEIEPLIGAFFVGVGLNPIVPNRSPLMRVTDFFGNAFFIPTFLVSVGLLFDPEVMFVWETIRLAIAFGAALIVGKAIAAWLSGRIFDLTRAEVGLMFGVSVAQAAATQLDHHLARHESLLPAGGEEGPLSRLVNLAGRLTEPVGGVVQPLVVVTSTEESAIAVGRERQARANRVLRHAGQDVECRLRIDASAASGTNREAFQSNSSMLLLGWPGVDDIRSRLLGADYGEIVAATALPVTIAALHDASHAAGTRIILFARDRDLVPGRLPSLRLGADIASMLTGHRHPLIVGPVPPDAVAEHGIVLPEHATHRLEPDELSAFVAEHSEPGDILILPTRTIDIGSRAVKIFESGRSVLVVTHNPESQSSLSGNTMTLPLNASV